MRIWIGGLLAAGVVCGVTACSAGEPEAPARPDDIRSLGYDDREATYFDKASITRTGDIAKITGISVYRPDRVENGVHRAEVFYEVDCASPRGSIAAVKEFDQAGAVKSKQRFRQTQWHPIREGIMGYYMREAACTPAEAEKKRPVTDIQTDARLTFAYLAPGRPKPPQIRRVGAGRKSAQYFDAASIERTGDVTRAKVITVYNRAVGGPEDGEVVSVITEDFDCARGRSNFITAASYDAAGKILKEGAYTEVQWADLVPGSIGDDFKQAVCSPEAVETAPLVADYRADAVEAFRRAR